MARNTHPQYQMTKSHIDELDRRTQVNQGAMTDDDGRRPSSAPGNKNDGATISTEITRIPKRLPPLLRTKSESHPRDTDSETGHDDEHYRGARHGFEENYLSEDVLVTLASRWQMYYTDKRYETTGKPIVSNFKLEEWRMHDRLKTISAALAICLNLDVEPPDQLRTTPGARMEAWIDPTAPVGPKALDAIGKALQSQYETLAIRTRYKQYLDPSVDETRKFCQSLRRNAKDERVLFHYNGHGVPKPTVSGEFWVFNRNYTQYIPVSLFDLQAWLAGPTMFVWDCSEAGNIVNNYPRFVEKHEAEDNEAKAIDPNHQTVNYRPFIHLAACRTGEHLPTNPLLPADLFTCCLTTPIHMALVYFALQNPLKTNISPERARALPGRLQERRTPLGELNWIFTAIADTIAWTTLPRDLFRKFFRQDLMVAALFRNFLLAQRIMSTYGCHPQSFPELPDTRQHPLWKSWDWAVDMALAQLPMLELKGKAGIEYEYEHSEFFADQLTAFHTYLAQCDAIKQQPPEQLPVVLQVLLSQQHRVRALILLGRFLDLGPWAVQLALSIGIFPYVLKLLQSTAMELRPVMIFIWTRLLAVDNSCQVDLVKDSCYVYFATILKPHEPIPVADADEHKAMCAFIIAMVCRDYEIGQRSCNSSDIILSCLLHIQNPSNALLRQWACLCLSQLWQTLPEAKWRGIREDALSKLSTLSKDLNCEVRASMLYAMTTFLGIPEITPEVQKIEEGLAWTVLGMANDGSAIVRREFLVFLSTFIVRYESKFVVAAYEQMVEEDLASKTPQRDDTTETRSGLHYALPGDREKDGSIKPSARGLSYNTVFAAMWRVALTMSVDAHPEVQKEASIIVDYVVDAVLQSPVGPNARKLLAVLYRKYTMHSSRHASKNSLMNNASSSMSNTPLSSPGLLRRTASMLFPLGAFFNNEDKPSSTNPSPTTTPANHSHRASSMRNPPLNAATTTSGDQNDDGNSQAHYHVCREPVSGIFQPRDLSEPAKLPLPSTILDWAIGYFREPQMKPVEADEPGSTEYNERLWRRSRNEGILKKTQPLKSFAGSHKWNNQLGMLNNSSQPVKMTFHQYEDHLAAADDGNTVTVWDWKKQGVLSRFSNGNPPGSKIRNLRFINEDDQALLMLGSSDGVIRIYRGYESEGQIQLATAWRALTDMVPSTINSGMAVDWQQVSGRVLAAGDVRVIRAWDAASEMCTMDIPARSGSCVTSLTSDQMTGNTLVAGFGDGAVRVYDLRLKPQDSMIKKWRDESDRQWVMTVHMQRGGQRELLSASRNGKVRLWDIRMDKPLHTFQTTRDTLRTASTHEHLPVFAVGTSTHTVKVFNLDGQELSRVEPYSSFLQQTRSNPISATDFHPHRPILAASAWGDTHINLFTCENQESEVHV
ncbi:Target of rapamycin complex 1 subunit mip1 [Ceratocystis fimbriata CBS 114723]|uniref:Target of rapamycin complex 1 subunit mip1 n=1 Tax=Ceratocystis fimbriata CBS 114723 TaxID=1035309 RepID=A0A2C5WZ61_9PEZI|nr:Target of rapamycin complex 1 subunit mip1 [Ceratocystis fimbriata CBS 114723]